MVDITTLWLQARPLLVIDFMSLIGDHPGLFMCRMFDESRQWL